MTIKNILIDLDGTLTDPKAGIHRSICYALEKLGHSLADEDDWTSVESLISELIKYSR